MQQKWADADPQIPQHLKLGRENDLQLRLAARQTDPHQFLKVRSVLHDELFQVAEVTVQACQALGPEAYLVHSDDVLELHALQGRTVGQDRLQGVLGHVHIGQVERPEGGEPRRRRQPGVGKYAAVHLEGFEGGELEEGPWEGGLGGRVEHVDVDFSDAVAREGAEPAVDDAQAVGDAPPVHDEAEAADADVRAGGEDVGDRADDPVATAAFLRRELLARVEVEEGLVEQAAPPRREHRRPPGVAEGEVGEDGQQDGVRELTDSVPAVSGRPIGDVAHIAAAGHRASAFGRPAA
uniref:Uncharacterized protein n=1 Tax=Arundo donax TaxID=35708 RepID=A0A0A9FQK7_ARUDO